MYDQNFYLGAWVDVGVGVGLTVIDAYKLDGARSLKIFLKLLERVLVNDIEMSVGEGT